jgi:signal transduction histidine kinase
MPVGDDKRRETLMPTDPSILPPTKAHVLVVDDHPANLLAVEAMLSDREVFLVKAPSGREALRLLDTDDFAVVLLDVRMVGMDGFETAKHMRARERSRHTPIIFLTAYDDDRLLIEQAYSLGAVDYLVKPIEPVVLRSKVAVFVDLYLKTDQVKRQAELLRKLEQGEFERKLAEENARLRASEDRLQEEARRKDEFLAMLSHELRNPLAPILNATHAIRVHGAKDAAKIVWAQDIIERQALQLSKLVDDLLDVSRITRGKVELKLATVELAAAATQAIEGCRPLLDGRQQQLAVSFPNEPLAVHADQVRLVQVLSNLLNNAAKYTAKGGQVWLTIERENEEAVVSVRDNGTGIDGKLLPNVFDLFTQCDRSLARSEGGLGIGLTIVKSLVEMHRGRVEARSEGLGKGSEFIVRLPRVDSSVANPTIDAVERGITPRRVLVVDDNADAADTLADLLMDEGHDVRIAHDGLTALREAASFRPRVVFLDLGLPGMDGYEVARRIRAQLDLGSVQLIALTGYGQEEDRRRTAAAGFNAHVVKPASAEALLALAVSDANC